MLEILETLLAVFIASKSKIGTYKIKLFVTADCNF